ncbi:MAG: hypothetical protein AAB532_02030 [Patescibacteria group bacterium]
MSNKAYVPNKIKFYYKNSDFKSVLKEVSILNIGEIKSKETLYMITLAYDQVALKKNKRTMKSMQRLAKKYASIIIKRFPSWDKGYFVMGLVLQHSNKAGLALNFYKKAQQKNLKNTLYYLSLGNGHRAIKNYKLSQYWYEKALKIKKIRHLASVNLVSLYEEMNEEDLVKKYAKKSLGLLKNKKDPFSINQKERMRKILKLS